MAGTTLKGIAIFGFGTLVPMESIQSVEATNYMSNSLSMVLSNSIQSVESVTLAATPISMTGLDNDGIVQKQQGTYIAQKASNSPTRIASNNNIMDLNELLRTQQDRANTPTNSAPLLRFDENIVNKVVQSVELGRISMGITDI